DAATAARQTAVRRAVPLAGGGRALCSRAQGFLRREHQYWGPAEGLLRPGCTREREKEESSGRDLQSRHDFALRGGGSVRCVGRSAGSPIYAREARIALPRTDRRL